MTGDVPDRLSSSEPDESLIDQLIMSACDVRKRAYAPYSNFSVGAALASVGGEIFLGCNIENASYGATICAERVAAGTARCAGTTDWSVLVIATEGGVPPCGICRQFLSEFRPSLPLVLYDAEHGTHRHVKLDEIFPTPFQTP